MKMKFYVIRIIGEGARSIRDKARSAGSAAADILIRDKINRVIIAVICCVLIVPCFVIFDVLPPLNFLYSKDGAYAKATPPKNSPVALSPGRFFPSVRSRETYETAFRRTLGQLRKEDSISVVLDLRDSCLLLVCHGVVLRTCPISGYHVSASWRLLRDRAWEYAESAFTTEFASATIAKVPVTVKKAPKDTLAAARENFRDTCSVPKKGGVAVALWLSGGLEIRIAQDKPFSVKERLFSLPSFYCSILLIETRRAASDLCHGRIPRQPVAISMRLASDDAAIVYRAFPKDGKVAVHL